eukprot:scaffold36311_cov119-Isochrysis_galbana.AAC.3
MTGSWVCNRLAQSSSAESDRRQKRPQRRHRRRATPGMAVLNSTNPSKHEAQGHQHDSTTQMK